MWEERYRTGTAQPVPWGWGTCSISSGSPVGALLAAPQPPIRSLSWHWPTAQRCGLAGWLLWRCGWVAPPLLPPYYPWGHFRVRSLMSAQCILVSAPSILASPCHSRAGSSVGFHMWLP